MQQNFIFSAYPLLGELAKEGIDITIDKKGEVPLQGFFKNECRLKLIYDPTQVPEVKKIIALYREGKSKEVMEVEINHIDDLLKLNYLAWISNPVKNSPTGFAEPEKGWRELFAKKRWVKFLRLSVPDNNAFEAAFQVEETAKTNQVEKNVELEMVESEENIVPTIKKQNDNDFEL